MIKILDVLGSKLIINKIDTDSKKYIERIKYSSKEKISSSKLRYYKNS